MIKIRHLRIKIIFAFGTILLLTLSVFSFIRTNNLMRSSELVNHTNVVKLELECIFSELKDAESSNRGYLITHNVDFQNQFNHSIINANNHFINIRLLVVDNYSQRSNIDVLKVLMDKRIEYMHSLIKMANEGTFTPDRLITGKGLMDKVRKQVDKMMAEEDFLLRLRTKSLTKEYTVTPLFTIFLIISSIVVLILSYYGMNRELNISNLLKINLEERKQELLEANDFLEDKNKSLAVMNKELESFTYISSHDLQEPLRKIQTFITRITESESENISEKARDYLIRTNEAAKRMQILIRDLLAYSRLNIEIFPLENFSLNAIVDEVRDDLDEDIKACGGIIEVKGNAEVKIIVSQFRQLLTNLISNSLKFSKPEKPPYIIIENTLVNGSEINGVVSEIAYTKITISDNGIGFDTQYKNRIFEVFQRLHMVKEYPGTGIGLAIVKKIVENHNGFITADSEFGEGAVFQIYIPA